MTAPTPLEALGRVLAEVSAASQQQTQVLQVLMGRAAGTTGAGATAAMQRMAEAEDPQTFLDVFEATATSCKWPEDEWGIILLPLLAGEAHRAALSLPAAARLQFSNQRRACLDRVGRNPEDHRRRFRALRLGLKDRPFILAQQLRDAATRWLQPGEPDRRMFELILLEQFIDSIPARTAAWVRYHRPRDLEAAVTLAEDHLAVQREATTKPAERPTPSPRRRLAPPEEAALEPRPREQVPGWAIPAPPPHVHTVSGIITL
ncbi:zinc finger protein 397-like [Nerophis ophidion]|uniref:zinc finger protein 397-like n=1 Tax=Nerophis ophidion TaxID=159077 RepID=UPI002AE02C26|nr:zinc finger protein 397-like [Nerophis ophidion]